MTRPLPWKCRKGATRGVHDENHVASLLGDASSDIAGAQEYSKPCETGSVSARVLRQESERRSPGQHDVVTPIRTQSTRTIKFVLQNSFSTQGAYDDVDSWYNEPTHFHQLAEKTCVDILGKIRTLYVKVVISDIREIEWHSDTSVMEAYPGQPPQRVIKGLLDVKLYDSTGMVTMIDMAHGQTGLAEDVSTDSDVFISIFRHYIGAAKCKRGASGLYAIKRWKGYESDDTNRMATQATVRKKYASRVESTCFAIVYKPLCKIIAVDDLRPSRIQWALHNSLEFGIFADDANNTAQDLQLIGGAHVLAKEHAPTPSIFSHPFVVSVGNEDTAQSVRAKIVSVLKDPEVIKMGLDYDADIRISVIENLFTPGPIKEICSNHHTRYYFRSSPQEKSGGAVGEDLNHGADVLRSHDADGNRLKMWKVFQHVKINNQIPATEGEPIKNVNEFMFGVEYLRKNGSYYNNDFGGYNTRGKGATGGGYATF